MKKTTSVLVFLQIMFASVLAFSLPFWPSEGASFFQYEDGVTLSITECLGPGRICYNFEQSSCDWSIGFLIGDDGDVYATDGSSYCVGGFDPDLWGVNPPAKFLDLPLEVGKTWASEASTAAVVQGEAALSFGTVLSAGILSTPMGDLEYYEVYISGIYSRVDGIYYINEQFGPIKVPNGSVIVGATGTVSTDGTAWGSLKAQFR